MRSKVLAVLATGLMMAGCSMSTAEVELPRIAKAEELGTELVRAVFGEDALTEWERATWEGGMTCTAWCMGTSTSMDLDGTYTLDDMERLADTARAAGWDVSKRSDLSGGWRSQRLSIDDVDLSVSWRDGELGLWMGSRDYPVEPFVLAIENPCPFDVTAVWWWTIGDWDFAAPSIVSPDDVLFVPSGQEIELQQFPDGHGLLLIPELGWGEQHTMVFGEKATASIPAATCQDGPNTGLATAHALLLQTLSAVASDTDTSEAKVSARTLTCLGSDPLAKYPIALTWEIWIRTEDEESSGLDLLHAMSTYWEDNFGVDAPVRPQSRWPDVTTTIGETRLEAGGLITGTVQLIAYGPCFDLYDVIEASSP